MKICKYGITLNLLSQHDLEFVREKRNSENSDPVSESTGEITSEMQQQWFDSINITKNLYFIVEYKGIRSGMVNTQITDWQKGSAVSELTLWNESFEETEISLLALLCLLEVEFYYLDWKVSYLRIKSNNTNAIESATSLGYELTESGQNSENPLYFLNREAFETKGRQAQLKAQPFKEKGTDEGYLLLEPVDYKSGIAHKIENHITESGVYLRRKGKAGSRMYFRQ